MANDCDFKVRITGESNDLLKLSSKLNCSEIQDSGSLNVDTYQLIFESCDDVEDWGSKWTVLSNIDFSEGDTMMFIDGYSAWSPTEGFWKKMSKDYNLQLILDYSEPGVGFAGVVEYNDGVEVLHDKLSYWEYLYERDYEYFWEEIGYRAECFTLEEISEDLGDTYHNLSDEEKQRIAEIQKERFVE
jgi:hypothetical protein